MEWLDIGTAPSDGTKFEGRYICVDGSTLDFECSIIAGRIVKWGTVNVTMNPSLWRPASESKGA